MGSEITSAILSALGVAGAWFTTWLARRGQREDHKIQIGNQALLALKDLADKRKEEIERYQIRIVTLEERLDKVQKIWEGRWDRQMGRCRTITDAAANELATLMHRVINPKTRSHVNGVLQDIEDHAMTDHDPNALPTFADELDADNQQAS